MLYYADDTILFSTGNRAWNELLKLTETISGKYGLLVLSREFSGMIHFITSNVVIPATSSNPSIPYVKRTSKRDCMTLNKDNVAIQMNGAVVHL